MNFLFFVAKEIPKNPPKTARKLSLEESAVDGAGDKDSCEVQGEEDDWPEELVQGSNIHSK
jgi:hypothetical protein